MTESSVARVYAAALFAAARDKGEIDPVRAELAAFAGVLHESSHLRAVLLDPQVQRAAKRRVIEGVCTDTSVLVVNLLRLLLDKGRISIVGDVHEEFERLAMEAARIVDVEVTSAVPISDADERDIIERVRRATGRTARLRRQLDEQVVGGLVLRVGDVVLDASLRARLQQLHDRLQHAEMRGGGQ